MFVWCGEGLDSSSVWTEQQPWLLLSPTGQISECGAGKLEEWLLSGPLTHPLLPPAAAVTPAGSCYPRSAGPPAAACTQLRHPITSEQSGQPPQGARDEPREETVGSGAARWPAVAGGKTPRFSTALVVTLTTF